MATLSVSVMAHPKRAALVQRLVGRLGVGPARVTWDQRGDRWDTGRRAWLHHDPEADWHLVVQDDAKVCADLPEGLAKALDHVPDTAVVSAYVGTRRPARTAVARLVDQARREQPSWLVMPTLAWGVAIAAPTSSIPGMVAWCDQFTVPQYDRRIATYYRDQQGWDTWYTWPSLVDHSQVRSLIGHAPGRVAHQFAGEDTSALAVVWDGGVLRAPVLAAPRRNSHHRREEAPMTEPTRRQRARAYVDRRQRRRLHRPGGPAPQPAPPPDDAYALAAERQESYQDPAPPDTAPPVAEPAAVSSEPSPEPATEPAVEPQADVTAADVEAGGDQAAADPPPRSGKGSTVAAWRDHLASLGVPAVDLDGLTKAQLIELYDKRF